MGRSYAASAWPSRAPAPVIAISKVGSGTTAPWRAGPALFYAAGSPAGHPARPGPGEIVKSARQRGGSMIWSRSSANRGALHQSALRPGLLPAHERVEIEREWGAMHRHVTPNKSHVTFA